MRVAVIGAGIVGVTTAYELAADGHQVTVFERRGAVAEETSFANAGVVAPGYVTPWAAPGMPSKVLRYLFSRHAPVKLGYDRARARDANWLFTNERIPPHAPQHIQDEYLEFVSALGIDPEPVEWRIGPWDDERAWQRDFVRQFVRPIVSLVIGTSRPQKDWIAERWGELADALSGRFGLQPVLVGGRSPREEATERLILERTRHKPVTALNSGLRRLISILDASALVISLDTGPLHMAVALDRPVISLLGFSNPLRTGPHRASRELIVNAYGEMWNGARLATDRRLDRMQTITVSDVLEKVAIWKERYAGDRSESGPKS